MLLTFFFLDLFLQEIFDLANTGIPEYRHTGIFSLECIPVWSLPATVRNKDLISFADIRFNEEEEEE
jgi:hypothetical protein